MEAKFFKKLREQDRGGRGGPAVDFVVRDWDPAALEAALAAFREAGKVEPPAVDWQEFEAREWREQC